MSTWYMFPKEQSDPFLPPLFAFDAIDKEDSVSAAQWTKVPLEDGMRVADARHVDPDIHTVEGMLSPLLPFGAPRGVPGVTDLVSKAVKALKAGTILTCVFAFDVVDLGLVKAARALSVSDGFALRVALELTEVRIVTTETITVPTSRLRRSLRRKAAQRKGGVSTAPLPLDDPRRVVRDLPKDNLVGKRFLVAGPIDPLSPP